MTTLYGKEALEVLTSNAPDFEELDEGQQDKYNHETCHMGVDTKHRLYVKNVDGAYLWHCHNCNTSGFYRPRETVARIRTSHKTETPVTSMIKLLDEYYRTAINDMSFFKPEGQLWLAQYGFDVSRAKAVGIRELNTGIALPVYDGNYKVVGLQVRQYTGKPKYLTATPVRASWLVNNVTSTTIVVEDLLSSYKLYLAGYNSLCLLGTSLSSQAAVMLANSKRVVLWLDDDEAGHKASLSIYKQVSPYAKEVSTLFLEQPKEIGFSVLKDMEL
jgi:hypothetical protein